MSLLKGEFLMTTAVLPLISGAPAATPEQNPQTLNRFVAYDPAKQALSNGRWSKAWTIASLVCAAAFLVFAAAADIYMTTYWESSPLAIFGATVLTCGIGLMISLRVVKYMWDKANGYSSEAKADRAVLQHMENLGSNTVSGKLKELGISSKIKTSRLKSLFASYLYWRDRHATLADMVEKTDYSASSEKKVRLQIEEEFVEVMPKDYAIDKVDFSNAREVEIFEELQTKRADRLELISTAALCKLKAAYMIKILSNPYEKRSESSFYTLSKTNVLNRLLAKGYRDTSAGVLIQANGKKHSASEISAAKTIDLARGIFGVPTNTSGTDTE